MHDIARHAGVSQATVSYVLNKRKPANGTISEETQRRVMESASALNYRTNELAKSMSTGKNPVLGVLTVPESGENVIRIMTGAIEAAEEKGYLCKVMHLSHSSINTDVISRCQEWRLAGVMAFGFDDETLGYLDGQFERIRMPFGVVDSTPSTSHWSGRFCSDDANGIRLAVNHLAGQGHTRIGFIGGRPSDLSTWREQAFYDVMKELGLDVHPEWVRRSSWGVKNIIEEAAVAVLQDATHRPTAIACSSDGIALVVLRVARSLGLSVPGDLSLTGYGNANLSSFFDPPLTTVDQPFQKMGYVAAVHLIACAGSTGFRESGESRGAILPTILIERESVTPPH